MNQELRDTALTRLQQAFAPKICKSIEDGAYDYAYQFCKASNADDKMLPAIYASVVEDLIYNADPNNATMRTILEKISQKTLNPYNLSFMKAQDLDYDKWEKYLARRETSNTHLNNIPAMEWDACLDCGNIKHYHYQLQTRGADEPITNFYKCAVCAKMTRLNN